MDFLRGLVGFIVLVLLGLVGFIGLALMLPFVLLAGVGAILVSFFDPTVFDPKALNGPPSWRKK